MSWLRLLRSRRVGVATFFRLMAEHGDAEAALAALPRVAQAAGVTDYQACPPGVAMAELKAGRLAGAKLIPFGASEYPAALYDLTDPPPLLWVRGRLDLLNTSAIALVGARNASSLGTRMARKLAGDLGAEGHTVVSGLARGIDTAAHLAALPTGTIAVMAGGVDVIYPAENAVLAQEICETGLCVSEQPMGLTPTARHFPRRNRIISGMSRGVVVVEAAARSGSLITARDALDQGREVFAVPGHPFDGRASGCNMLIRDGATLVRGAADILDSLAPIAERPATAPQPAETVSTARRPAVAAATSATIVPLPVTRSAKDSRSLRETNALHQKILDRLSPSPLAEDQLIRDLAVSAGEVAPEIITLELDGKIARQPGGLLTLL